MEGSKTTSRLLPEGRPLSLGEAWGVALTLYLRDFLTIVGIALIVSLIGGLLRATASEPQPLLLVLLFALLGALVGLLGYFALAKAILDRLYERPIRIPSAFGFALAKIGPILWTVLWIVGLVVVPFFLAWLLSLLVPLLGLLGMVAVFVLYLLVLLFTSFVPFVLVDEELYGWNCIERSYELVRSDWVPVLITALLAYIPPALLDWLFPQSWVVVGLVALYFPLPYIVLALLYLDARRTQREPS